MATSPDRDEVLKAAAAKFGDKFYTVGLVNLETHNVTSVRAFPDHELARNAVITECGDDAVWTRPNWTAVSDNLSLCWVISELLRKEQADGYFGLCPHCLNNDGYINVGRSHWFLCDEHKVKWCVGANLFSSWVDETEEEQRAAYYARGVDRYTEIEPCCPQPQ